MTKSMRLTLSTLLAGMVASPAFAATGPFFSLRNTDFIVLLAFLLFLGGVAAGCLAAYILGAILILSRRRPA